MNRRFWPRAAAVAAVLALGAGNVYGAPRGPGYTEEDEQRYDAETMARLTDNVIEYDEIPLRVREYNPTVSQIWETYRDSGEDYKDMVTEMEDQYRTVVKDMADDYVSMGKLMAGTEAGKTMVAAGKTLDSTYRSTMQGFRDTVADWDTNLVNTFQIRQAEKQVTAGVEQAMIGYETIRQNIDTLRTMVQLYEKQSAMTERMAALGMATETDLLSARSSLIAAQSQLLSLENQQDSVRRTLCSLLGYDPDSNPEIRPIPEFDMSRLDSMNLAEDTSKAIGNNYTLISQRTSAKGKNSTGIQLRLDRIHEGEEKLTIEMQRLYEDVMDKKAAYDAAVVGYTAAETSRAASRRQYDLGLLSEMQFIGTELSYYQKRAAKESANLSLLQAMENYDWGVMGLAAVE